MQYFGGKNRIADKIVAVMQPHIDARGNYVEPFVGGANVLCKVKAARRFAYDANEALINMYKALADGWVPPDFLSDTEYAELKKQQDPLNPLTAFAGFGCSFAGKWFGGYARNRGSDRNYAKNAKNSVLDKMATLNDVCWRAVDYQAASYPTCAVVYCDPPYQGTTQYGAVGNFDSAMFWAFCRLLTTDDRLVFVSEYDAPADFKCVLEISTRTDIRNTDNAQDPRTEKLFVHESVNL